MRVFAGKSFGTTALLQIVERKQIHASDACIWLTPGTPGERSLSWIAGHANKSLVVCGSADSFYWKELIEKAAENPAVTVKVFEQADHGLEIDGDYRKAIAIMRELAEAVERFVQIL